MRFPPLLSAGALAASVWLVACGGDGGTAPPPPVVQVSVTPSTAAVGAGGTASFTAAVVNATNVGVTWTASGGTLAPSGTSANWTAPVQGGSYTITATSSADPSKSAAATVTVTPVTVAVSSAASAVFRGATTAVTATVGGGSDTRVTWSASCGTITGDGASVQYTAPEVAGDCVISATSVLDPATSGRDTVTVRRAWRVATLSDTDDGACTFAHCSLREAIIAANAAADADSILLFPGETTAGTIALTSALPVVRQPLQLIGPGPSALTIDANATAAAPRGVLHVDGDLTATVRGLTVRRGLRVGGAGVLLDNGARVTLQEVHVRENTSVNAAGGGILALRGTQATLIDVDVVGNRATGSNGPGGGVSVEPGSQVTMRRGRISGNEAPAAFGGGARVFNGRLQLDSVLVAGNRGGDMSAGTGVGGGVFSDGADAVVLITGSTIEDNEAGFSGGGLALRGGTVSTLSGGIVRTNRAPSAAGIEVGSATTTVTGTIVSANVAAQRGGGVFLFGTAQYTHTGGAIRTNDGGTGGGGGIYAQQDARLTLTDVNVDENRLSGSSGAGLWAGGNVSVTITRGTISRNTGALLGGGVFITVARPLDFTGVVIEENVARDGGGGLFLSAATVQAGGRLRGGRIAGNRSVTGGGGGMFSQNVSLTVDSVTFASNQAAQGGGAYLALLGGTLAFTDIVAEDNTANLGGALGFNGTMSVTITRGVLRRNTSVTVGGGLWKAGQSVLSMTGTEVRDNTAGTQGGGLQLAGPGAAATLTNITVRGNRATTASGGGLTAGVPVQIIGSTFADNTSGAIGGGIFSASTGNAVIRNSTFSNNAAVVGGGVAATGPAALTNVTFVANRATDYGGGVGTNNAGAMTLTNVLLSGNRVGEATANCGSGGSSVIASGGGNLADDTACGTLTQPSDRTNTPAGVSPTLANNGGPTLTHALLESSAAINAAVVSACPATDQRGFGRVGACDVGAVEFGGSAPAGAARAAAAGRYRP